MRTTIKKFFFMFIVLFLFLFACNNDTNGIAAGSTDDINKINANVVKRPKKVMHYNYDQTVDNCAPGKTIHTFTTSHLSGTSIVFSKTASGGGSVGVDISVIKADLEGAIEKGYKNIFEQSKKEEFKASKDIPPWHVMHISVKVTKEIYESKISYKKGKKEYAIPYRYIIEVPVPERVSFKWSKCAGQPHSVDIRPSYKKLEVGEKIQLKAELLDTDNKVLSQKKFAWKSSQPGIATVSRDGKVTARGEGKARITAAAQNKTGEASINVVQIVRRVTIKPPKITLQFGENISLDSFVTGSSGVRLDKKVRWSSNNQKIVSISQQGVASTRWIGTATITATCDQIKGVAEITISPPQIHYPEHNITLIVPSGIGSSSDIMGRRISRFLGEEISMKNKKVVLMNVPGGRGRNGWKRTLSSKADGYTLALYNKNLPLSGNPGLDDFYPIAMFAKTEKSMYGLVAPGGTPKKIIAVLEHAIKNMTKSDAFIKAFQRAGLKEHFVSSIDFVEAAKRY